jgi:hypothetical protein
MYILEWWDSLADIEDRLGAGRPRKRDSILGGKRGFSLLNRIQTGSGFQPVSYIKCSVVKQQRCEADDSSPSISEVKNG